MEGKPRVSAPEPQMAVVEGRTATLRCHAHGKMMPSRATFPRLLRFQTRSDITGTQRSDLLTINCFQVFQRL